MDKRTIIDYSKTDRLFPETLKLVAHQYDSYHRFLHKGLPTLMAGCFPVEVPHFGRLVLTDYSVRFPEEDEPWLECLQDGTTYLARVYLSIEWRSVCSSAVGGPVQTHFHVNIPTATPAGSLIISGCELVFPALMTEYPDNDLQHIRLQMLEDRFGPYLVATLEMFTSAISERIRYGTPAELSSMELQEMIPLQDSIDEFFVNNPLLQRIDGTNPVARLTHLRRVCREGRGSRQYGFSERMVHPSQFGRLDYFETPEGPNVGLVHTLGVWAQVDESGAICTPYESVRNGERTGEIRFLSPQEDFAEPKASWSESPEDAALPYVWSRCRDAFIPVDRDKVSLAEISPVQGLGHASLLVPFLGHDDSNRALMGVNMQRQALALAGPEVPWVLSGAEKHVARWSDAAVFSPVDGTVLSVTEKAIIIQRKDTSPWSVSLQDPLGLPRRVRVKPGQEIVSGELLADGGFSTDGLLTLGSNALVGYLSWDGYNFEDAIVVSDALLERDAFTSILPNRRKLQIGDKLCNRHGAKGVVSRIVPAAQMPRLPDGRPLEMLFSPLGVVPRLIFGAVLETAAGLAGQALGKRIISPPYCGASVTEIQTLLEQAGFPASGMLPLIDPRNGKALDQSVAVGYQYILKLNHMAEQKLITRRQILGQREMMALVALGASSILQEAVTGKSIRAQGDTEYTPAFTSLAGAAEMVLVDIRPNVGEGN